MPDYTLSNHDLNTMLSEIPGYLGSFAKDQLPSKLLKTGQSIIINLDDISGPGTHWVALYQIKPKVSIYFDPFGLSPPESVKSFAKRNNRDLIYSTGQIQGVSSTKCGYFCVHFIKALARGTSPFDSVYSFDQRPSERNETIVIKK